MDLFPFPLCTALSIGKTIESHFLDDDGDSALKKDLFFLARFIPVALRLCSSQVRTVSAANKKFAENLGYAQLFSDILGT